MFYQKTVLSNGVTVVTESMPDVRSVSVGFWFNVGSRDERPDQAGLTHFMEHMMFKGTKTRTALDISMQFDSLGAELNAFTGKEFTCYYARFVDNKIEQALPILSDMVINSQFTQETIDPERKVVIEEISRTEDTPDDYIFDLYGRAALPDHPLGKPVLGTRELVSGYRHEDCVAFHEEHYHTGNLIVAIAGHVDHDSVVAQLETLLADMRVGTRKARPFVTLGERKPFIAQKKETEQAHLIIGTPWFAFDDERRYDGALAASMLGGSMSSRLFQEVREKRGLVYSIFAYPSAYQDCGTFGVYAGTNPDNISQIVEIVEAELDRFCMDGPTEEERTRTCESICGQLLLGLESTSTRMLRLGRTFIRGGKLNSVDEITERYQSATCESVRSVADTFLSQARTFAVISPFDESDAEAKVFHTR